MSSNSSDGNTNNNGGGGGSNGSEFVVAAVALVVSVVALLATFMQVLQQYYASAQGYSQCNEKVMGNWATTKTRRFQWSELRFEVQFDAPVIFVSPPTNKNGPVPDADIFFLNGTKDSLDATWTTKDMDLRNEYKMKSEKERIHTAENERASWWILLFAIQRMEAKSREWQESEYKAIGPPSQHMLPQTPPSLEEHHTLTVALQRKRKSWDTMPTSVIKPYATTTICHLIEMMAALGVYWKEFDRTRDRYWAEGNGFMVLGERLSDLGLMFSFQVSGQCTFERNRVIPVDEIKELCFGYVPTIYREKLDQRRLKPPSDEQQSLSSLQMGSIREIAETLTLIGCNNNTVSYFLEEGTRTSHLFPVSFEILGMLSRTFHIDNSRFTYIPNPTPDRWDKRSVSFAKMLQAYSDELERLEKMEKLEEQEDLKSSKMLKKSGKSEESEDLEKSMQEALPPRLNGVIARRLRGHIGQILSHQDDQNSLECLLLLRALHSALDDTDEILTAKTKDQMKLANVNSTDHVPEKPSSRSPDTKRQKERQDMVQDVLRRHVQEVLRLLNYQDDRTSDTRSIRSDMLHWQSQQPQPRVSVLPIAPLRQFEDMDVAGPDERQEIFMEVYFGKIRTTAVSHATPPIIRRISVSGSPGGFDRTLAGGSIRSNASSIRVPLPDVSSSTAATPADDAVVSDEQHGLGDAHDELTREGHQDDSRITLADLTVSREDVWCTLVFRMICWLMLHDFHKKDIQMPKSELLGSRMPVYIA